MAGYTVKGCFRFRMRDTSTITFHKISTSSPKLVDISSPFPRAQLFSFSSFHTFSSTIPSENSRILYPRGMDFLQRPLLNSYLHSVYIGIVSVAFNAFEISFRSGIAEG